MGAFRKLMSAAVLAAAAMGVSAPVGASDHGRWGGIYIGANAGYTWGDIDWQYAAPAGAPGHLTRDLAGGMFGGHVGIQHQWNSLVIGAEASYSGPAFDKIDDRGPDSPAFVPAFDSYARLHNLFTVGPRLGWAPSDHWLLYATGGYATGRVSTADIVNATNTFNFAGSHRHDGWFVGGGVEYALTSNWILGVEYMHVDLDTATHFPTVPATFGGTRSIEGDFDVVRARLSFKLGRPEEKHESMK